MISNNEIVEFLNIIKEIFDEYYVICIDNFITIQTKDINPTQLDKIVSKLKNFNINIEPNDTCSLNINFFKKVK